jgi:hypothetical protein
MGYVVFLGQVIFPQPKEQTSDQNSATPLKDLFRTQQLSCSKQVNYPVKLPQFKAWNHFGY